MLVLCIIITDPWNHMFPISDFCLSMRRCLAVLSLCMEQGSGRMFSQLYLQNLTQGIRNYADRIIQVVSCIEYTDWTILVGSENLQIGQYKWQRLYREDDTLSIRDYTERIIRVGLEIIWIGQQKQSQRLYKQDNKYRIRDYTDRIIQTL